jgi:hypothetical protein
VLCGGRIAEDNADVSTAKKGYIAFLGTWRVLPLSIILETHLVPKSGVLSIVIQRTLKEAYDASG